MTKFNPTQAKASETKKLLPTNPKKTSKIQDLLSLP